jgi:FMN-binding domain
VSTPEGPTIRAESRPGTEEEPRPPSARGAAAASWVFPFESAVPRIIGALLLAGLAIGLTGDVGARVFYSMDQALQLAFPDASTIEKETLFLSEPEAHQVESLARARLESRMIPVHIGRHGQETLGYAMIDIHIVRTQPEAVLIVLDPGGKVASTILLAFAESFDYLPPGRWLRQFDRKTLTPDLALGQQIVAITGATLSTSGVTDSVRRALAVYQVKLAPKRH